MKKTKKGETAIRANVTIEARENVDRVKAQLLIAGRKLTQDETIDHMLKNYQER